MTYAEFTVGQVKRENALREIDAKLRVYPRNRFGLTKDAAKDADWYALKRAQATFLADEIRADRDARRAAILASRAA